MCKVETDVKKSIITFRSKLEKKNKNPTNDFYWEYTDEPHATRRKEIIKKYPEIKKLFGICPLTKYVICVAVSIQIIAAAYIKNTNWLQYFLILYIIGGTANHMMMMAMHELSHNLGFKKLIYNRIFSIIANLPVAVPSAISFKRYHMEHHRYQGEDGIDVDVPTYAEGKFFNNSIKKSFFVLTQVLFYSIRPMFVNPKIPSTWEYINYIICLTFDYLIYYYLGTSALLYLLLSTLVGAGAHPVAGHFIAEHYVFVKGYETYSYYGILNWLTFNVGYHNEHHDFPFVPGSRLPQIRSIAPEFYNNLPIHTSWIKVMYDYIMDPEISAFSRVKRKMMSNEEKKQLKFKSN